MPLRVVTAVAPRDGQRLAVELDGEPWIVLDAVTALRLGLDVDATVDDATQAEAARLAAEERALHRGARLVGRRSHAAGELEGKIARADGPDAARAAVERLAELGAVDDERHAILLAERRLAAGWGPLRIRHDLEAGGVADPLAEAVIAALDPDAVEAAARRALGPHTGPEGWRRLAARGFDEGTAERLLGAPPDA
jgi:regulatory protein